MFPTICRRRSNTWLTILHLLMYIRLTNYTKFPSSYLMVTRTKRYNSFQLCFCHYILQLKHASKFYWYSRQDSHLHTHRLEGGGLIYSTHESERWKTNFGRIKEGTGSIFHIKELKKNSFNFLLSPCIGG